MVVYHGLSIAPLNLRITLLSHCRYILQLTGIYPMVSKSLREIFIGKPANAPSGHCCAMTALGDQGLGYEDLNKLMREPQALEFILGELHKPAYTQLTVPLVV
mgnify:CR=1 FL=1